MVVQNAKKAPRFQTVKPQGESNIPPRAGRKVHPEEQIMQDEIATFDREITEITKKIATLDDQIKSRTASESANRQNFQQERENLTQEINDIQKEIDEKSKLRETTLRSIEEKKKSVFEKRVADRAPRRNVAPASDAEVAQKIAEIEHQLATAKLSIKDERDLKTKLADLTSTSAALKDLKKNPTNTALDLDADAKELGAMQGSIGTIREELDKLYDQKRTLLDKRQNLSKKQDSAHFSSQGDVRPLLNERDQLRKEKQIKQIKRDEVKDKLARQIKIWKAEDEEKATIKAAERAQQRAQEEYDYELSVLNRQLANVEAPINIAELSDLEFALAVLKAEHKKAAASTFELDFELLQVLGKHRISVPTKHADIETSISQIEKKKAVLVKAQDDSIRTVETRRAEIQTKIDALIAKGK